ncbi:signal peptidase complex subunit 3-like [Centruroides sculpturatus]|uniref:signal peptidase complex subunit 3-like n=1 Tax=Centruroides sculpturatus TaxID=218467 RepID=UPI000C6E296A|nr:signal peptidase complex subunit 3-like [Centruroides sculpturatus]
MNTVLSRANAIFAFTLSVLAGLTFLCFLSTAFNSYQAKVVVRSDRAVVNLTSLFNWNVKQLFLYLTTKKYTYFGNVLNQVVLWDKIIQRGENAILDYKKLNTKYYFWDDGNGLRGNKNVTLTLSWNIIPNAGSLPNIVGTGSHSYSFPTEYTTSRL